MFSVTQIEQHASFGGFLNRYTHQSKVLQCEMVFSVYLPPQAQTGACPVLYWLSGLTCTDENFAQKAGAQRIAAELGLIIVIPDTSPRGKDVPDDASEGLGQGASYYINAVTQPWAKNYQMFSYISEELPAIIEHKFRTTGKQSIAGHSMGGHGALMLSLRKPQMYQSVSAFAPSVNPSAAGNGRNVFKKLLGDDITLWEEYDSCFLMRRARPENYLPTLIDQGMADHYYPDPFYPEKLVQIAKEKDYPLTFCLRHEYDHSYYFVASFIEEHLRFHMQYLK